MFSPNSLGNPPFQCQVTLDGNVYTLAVTNNLYAKRWYVTITDLSGNRIVTVPLIGSPNGNPGVGLSLVVNLFTSTLIYRVQGQQFEINP